MFTLIQHRKMIFFFIFLPEKGELSLQVFGISLLGSEKPFRFSLAAATLHSKDDVRTLHIG